MIGLTNVEVDNLIYVAGALVLIVILSLVVTLRHRKPKSVESNMATFNKGLRALAPDNEPVRRSAPVRRRKGPEAPAVKSSLPPRTGTVHTIRPVPLSESPSAEESEEGPVEGSDQEPGEPADETPPPDEPATVRIDAAHDTPTTLEAETG